jgi:hypothetical protein
MIRAERTVQVLGLAVGRSARARFVEEWQADVSAGRALGLSEREILLAAGRVALFLLWVRARAQLLRYRSPVELLLTGTGLAPLLVIIDVPLEPTVPFVVLAVGCWAWGRLRAWIDGGS